MYRLSSKGGNVSDGKTDTSSPMQPISAFSFFPRPILRHAYVMITSFCFFFFGFSFLERMLAPYPSLSDIVTSGHHPKLMDEGLVLLWPYSVHNRRTMQQARLYKSRLAPITRGMFASHLSESSTEPQTTCQLVDQITGGRPSENGLSLRSIYRAASVALKR